MEEHRKGLIELYKDQLSQEKDNRYMIHVLKAAIVLLMTQKKHPQKIEDWVVSCEKFERAC